MYNQYMGYIVGIAYSGEFGQKTNLIWDNFFRFVGLCDEFLFVQKYILMAH